MASLAALLRAVNLAGKKTIPMLALRELFEGLHFTDVRTLLASGNVVFEGDGSGDAVEALLKKEAERRLGLSTEFFVRTAAEWRSIIARNPFPDAAKRDPGHLLVVFLKTAPRAPAVKALQAAITGRETVRTVGKQAYIIYPDGVGNSRLTMARIERHL